MCVCVCICFICVVSVCVYVCMWGCVCVCVVVYMGVYKPCTCIVYVIVPLCCFSWKGLVNVAQGQLAAAEQHYPACCTDY